MLKPVPESAAGVTHFVHKQNQNEITVFASMTHSLLLEVRFLEMICPNIVFQIWYNHYSNRIDSIDQNNYLFENMHILFL